MKLTQMLLEWALTSALLILVVIVLRALLGKRVSAGLRYALWAVVLVRLLVPVQLFTAPVAGMWTMAEPGGETGMTDAPFAPAAEALPDLTASAGAPEAVSVFSAPSAAPVSPAAPDLNALSGALGWIWLGGAAVMALVLVASNLQFSRRLRRMRIPLEGTACPLPVYRAAGLPSPCLFGLARPAVYVTPDAAADPQMLRHVLTHEYTHYRHGDHIWNILRSLALAVHWWNPLVWLAVALSCRDCELACDEGALRRLGDGERIAYGRTLLTLLTEKPRPASLLRCATTMTGGQKNVFDRVTRIARAPKRWLWAAVVLVLTAALACACSFASTEEAAPEPDLDDSSLSMEQQEDSPSFDAQEDDDSNSSASAADDQRQPDLNRNGVPEDLRVVPSDDGSEQRLEVWENEELLWSEAWTSSAHGGWASLFLCTLDGEDYLLRYTPTMYGGICDYTYTLFTLSADGEPQTAQENHIEADTNIGSPVYTGQYDPEAFAAFLDEINGLLSHSVQLLNTDPALSATFEREGRLYDSLWWLDQYEAFTRDPSKSLLENLRDFQTAMDSANGFQPSGSPVSEETWVQLQALFADGQFWYTQALTSEFRTPEEVDLRELFYRGIPGVDNTLQADERAYLEDIWSYEFQLDIVRLPADQMDAVLQAYLGVSLADTRGNGLDTLTYWAEADCYYLSRGDTNAIQVLPYSAYVQEDGTIRLAYDRSSFGAEPAEESSWVVTLQPTGSGYQIVSNQPAETAE